MGNAHGALGGLDGHADFAPGRTYSGGRKVSSAGNTCVPWSEVRAFPTLNPLLRPLLGPRRPINPSPNPRTLVFGSLTTPPRCSPTRRWATAVPSSTRTAPPPPTGVFPWTFRRSRTRATPRRAPCSRTTPSSAGRPRSPASAPPAIGRAAPGVSSTATAPTPYPPPPPPHSTPTMASARVPAFAARRAGSPRAPPRRRRASSLAPPSPTRASSSKTAASNEANPSDRTRPSCPATSARSASTSSHWDGSSVPSRRARRAPPPRTTRRRGARGTRTRRRRRRRRRPGSPVARHEGHRAHASSERRRDRTSRWRSRRGEENHRARAPRRGGVSRRRRDVPSRRVVSMRFVRVDANLLDAHLVVTARVESLPPQTGFAYDDVTTSANGVPLFEALPVASGSNAATATTTGACAGASADGARGDNSPRRSFHPRTFATSPSRYAWRVRTWSPPPRRERRRRTRDGWRSTTRR